MAFTIHRTETLGSTVTRQDLYDLIHTSTLQGSSSGGNTTPGIGVTAVSLAPDIPIDGKTWWWDMSKQLMKLPINSAHGSACSLWVSAGPDSWEIPVLNACAYTLVKGTLVSYKTAGDPGLYDIEPFAPLVSNISNTYFNWYETLTASPNQRSICGVIQADAAPGQIIPAVYKGCCYAKVEGFISLDNNTYLTALNISTAYTGVMLIQHKNTTTEYKEITRIGAMLCHPTPFSACSEGMLVPAFFTGPWNSGMYKAFSEDVVA